jgi:hypothetical protein
MFFYRILLGRLLVLDRMNPAILSTYLQHKLIAGILFVTDIANKYHKRICGATDGAILEVPMHESTN